MVLEELFCRRSALARFRNPPLGPEMDGFCGWLCQQGFSRSGLRRRVWQASHFNQCLRRWGVEQAQQVQRTHAERFIGEHLPRCRCRNGAGCSRAGVPSTALCVIDYLSQRGLLAVSAPPPCTPYQGLLQQYLDYLHGERNLAPTTLNAHRTSLTPFLEALGTPVEQRLRELCAQQLLAYFTESVQDQAPSRSRCLQGVLRSFLRYCLQQGYLERDLVPAIPALRTYKLAGVPRGICDDDARETLQSIDRTTPVGRRDFAIIELLNTYGVRGGQLRALRLEDIHWREERIRFPAAKRGKEVVVPLTDEVGESLLDYLRHARPHAPYREVFLTAQPPFQPLRSPATVSRLVAERMRRAGVSPPTAGSHTFRHAFATRMLQQGQSLKTIADLLGHRDLNTTFIYTKVDLNTLQQLPLDWPEVGP